MEPRFTTFFLCPGVCVFRTIAKEGAKGCGRMKHKQGKDNNPI